MPDEPTKVGVVVRLLAVFAPRVRHLLHLNIEVHRRGTARAQGVKRLHDSCDELERPKKPERELIAAVSARSD